MLSNMPVLPPDPLWALSAKVSRDPRPEKIDLVIGVYRDDQGQTPTFGAVKAAELALASAGDSKVYRALSGNAAFNAGMARLMLGDDAARLQRQHTIQAVGGTGALRVLADFVARVNPEATVWVSSPGYVNHLPIFQSARLATTEYDWRGQEGVLDIARVCSSLAGARRNDIVVLHGCCHNPTGMDPTPEDWHTLAEFLARQGLVPLIDLAYQGFGLGVEEDATGLRILADRLPTVLVAASCSKNMGLYCERVGAAMVIGESAQAIAPVAPLLERICRGIYGMPSDHGAAVGAVLLENPASWLAELSSMRDRIIGIRHQLCDTLEAEGAPPEMQQIRRHKGMFSLMPLSPDRMVRLREEFAVYGTENGRFNLAGLQMHQIPRLARALATVAR